MLTDEVIIIIKAGNGGDGAVSFRREKHVPRGGPDGGDGGTGGDVSIVADPSTHGLSQYRGKKTYSADSGDRGGKNRRSGKAGEPLVLTVPPGTKVTALAEEDKEIVLADLVTGEQQLLAARGGKGGKGNWHYRGPTNQTPRQFEPGRPGETKTLKLELQLIADVGLVGLPNAGKSTLLSVISNARPKIANYPFTTLEPNLGMVESGTRPFVVADIPGLIEGAASGKGLGIKFLKHILRTTLIVHLVPATEENPEITYKAIRKELAEFDKTLTDKKEIVVLSKIDIVPDWEKKHKKFIKAHKAHGLSAATNTGLKELLHEISNALTA